MTSSKKNTFHISKSIYNIAIFRLARATRTLRILCSTCAPEISPRQNFNEVKFWRDEISCYKVSERLFTQQIYATKMPGKKVCYLIVATRISHSAKISAHRKFAAVEVLRDASSTRGLQIFLHGEQVVASCFYAHAGKDFWKPADYGRLYRQPAVAIITRIYRPAVYYFQ